MGGFPTQVVAGANSGQPHSETEHFPNPTRAPAGLTQSPESPAGSPVHQVGKMVGTITCAPSTSFILHQLVLARKRSICGICSNR